MSDLIGALAAAKINITALDAVSVRGRYGAIFWVAPKDLRKATKIAGALSAEPAGVNAAIATMGI